MLSSIFKSTSIAAAAAAFLATPTAAQIGNWDVIYQSLETNFQDSVVNEVTLDYLIGAGRTFNIDLFDKGCADPITGMTITPTTALTPSTADHDQLEIMLDLDKSAITSSNIWSPAGNMLEFCVRVQLLSGGSVIKEDKRDVDIAFDFVVDFEADESVSMQTASLTSSSGQANVDSYVSACKCDNLESFTCNNTPLTPNSVLYVCIQSMDADVEIAFLNRLELFQSNTLGNETLLIVDGLFIQNDEISSFTPKNSTAVGVATVVPSRFFSYNGISTATVSGIVQVKLVGPARRRLAESKTVASFSSRRLLEGDASGRAMRGDIVGRPGYNGVEESPFEIAIQMERQVESVSYITIGPSDNSAGATKMFGATASLGTIISFVIALFW